MDIEDITLLAQSIIDDDDDEPVVKGKKSKGPPKSVQEWWNAWAASIEKGSDPESFKDIIETGMPTFDIAMGVGGLPRGSVMTVYGAEGCGKSTLWQMIVAAAQRQYPDMVVVIVDAEPGFNPAIAIRNGMQFSEELMKERKLFYINPSLDTGLSWERVAVMLEQLLMVAPDGAFIIIDSMDSMSTATEVGQDADDGGAKFGGLAKANSYILKRMSSLIKKHNSNMVIVQQARDKMNAQYPGQFETAGGRAVKHYSQVRIRMIRTKPIVRGEVTIGHRVKCRLEKNKYFEPFVEFELDLLYNDDVLGGGFDILGQWIDLAVESKFMSREKAEHKIISPDGEIKKISGRNAVRRWLANNPKEFGQLKTAIMNKIKGSTDDQ